MSPSPGLSIEGYSLLRKIGEGGFGEVWLSKSETTGAWKALKWISRSSYRHLEQELGALSRYSQAISGKRSPHLLPIEHIRLLEDALIYVMPLSDGFDGLSPHDPKWEPVTLSGLIARHRSHGSWFSLAEVKKIIDGVIQGAGLIGEAGLQHRDIKPENVIFSEGLPALGDFGLATEDMTQVSMRGTPHHAAPSWYLESGGNSDQWGVAILLYQLLTGNSPDKMGRPKYLKPPQGMLFHGEEERSEWNRLQSLVNRATSEVAGERFQGFEAFRKATSNPAQSHSPRPNKPRKMLVALGALAILLSLSISGVLLVLGFNRPVQNVGAAHAQETPKGKSQGDASSSHVKESNEVGYSMPHKFGDPAEVDPVASSEMLDNAATLRLGPRPINVYAKGDSPHIYSDQEERSLRQMMSAGNSEGVWELQSSNEARYQRITKQLPPETDFSVIVKKMRE